MLASAPPRGILAGFAKGNGDGMDVGGLESLSGGESGIMGLGGVSGKLHASLPLLSSLPDDLRGLIAPRIRGGRGGDADASSLTWGGKDDLNILSKEGAGGDAGGTHDGGILAGALRSSAAAASALIGNLSLW